MKAPRRLVAVAGVGLMALAVSAFPVAGRVQAAHPQKTAYTVGFLFSDFTTSARWEFDKAYFIRDLKKIDPTAKVIVEDAKASQTTQLNQAKALLTRGVNALIDVPVDSAGAAAIVKLAHAQKPRVPVLAYDRLITGAYEDAYASFDGFHVGVQQGQFLASHVKKGGTIVEIAGSPTDNNAKLFHSGAFSVLQPLFNKKTFTLGYHIFTPNWDDSVAQQEMTSALSRLHNKVDGVLSANDGMAGGIIQALKAQHLNGKVPVTGQDATVAGLQAILTGDQSMTVYKPLARLTAPAAKIIHDWLHHKVYKSKVKTNTGAGKTPSVIVSTEVVTKANIKSTVIKDGFVKKSDLCKGIPASDCSGL